MSQIITMPKLGLTMTQGMITRWYKKEGDPVKAGEAVVEIETDKITSGVESPCDGYLLEILAQKDEVRAITAPLCVVGDLSEAPSEEVSASGNKASNTPGKRLFITPIARKLAKENQIEYTAIKGTGPLGRITKRDILNVLNQSSRVRITPLAKNLAAENGIDYTKIKGAGPGGRIEKKDILAVIEATERPAAITEIVPLTVPRQSVPTEDESARRIVKRVPLSGIRKITAERLSQSKHDIPHVYFKISVDAKNLIELKNHVSEGVKVKTGKKLTLNDLIVKAAASVLGEFPEFNASLINNEIVYYQNVNVGIAVNSDKGLVVPVVKGAGRLSLSEICTRTGELVDRARSGKLDYEDLSGGTFTISNLGAYQIDEFSAIINPPESAILAVGTAREMPCVKSGEIVVSTVMNMTLSVDHRVIDGALAAKFMKRLKDVLEEPCLFLI
jgi:pyruvate dehydrogenase E2 component (dihydrolipoamide acetyltransferase)